METTHILVPYRVPKVSVTSNSQHFHINLSKNVFYTKLEKFSGTNLVSLLSNPSGFNLLVLEWSINETSVCLLVRWMEDNNLLLPPLPLKQKMLCQNMMLQQLLFFQKICNLISHPEKNNFKEGIPLPC